MPRCYPQRCMSLEAHIPNWARRERLSDLMWLNDNLHIFWPAAQQQYQEQGRGALVVDTTVQPEEGKGNPFGYVPQELIEEGDDADLKRMVREYVPDRELIVTLLKAQERISSYRVQVKEPGKK